MKTGEAGFQATFIDAAHLFGWKVAHFRKARTKHGWVTAVAGDGKGWNDNFCVQPVKGWCFAAELKMPGRKRTPEQTAWAQWLTMCGIAVFLWYPKDWPEIDAVLKNGPDSA